MDVGSTEYHLTDKITVSCRHEDNFGRFGSCGMNLKSKDQGMFDRVKRNQILEAHAQTLGHIYTETHMGQIPQDGDFGQNVAFF